MIILKKIKKQNKNVSIITFTNESKSVDIVIPGNVADAIVANIRLISNLSIEHERDNHSDIEE